MASHCHHHCHPQPQPRISTNLCCHCCCCASPTSNPSPSPKQSLTDPLIQAIAAAHLLQYPQPTHHLYTTHFLNPQHQQQQQHHHQRLQNQQEQEHSNTHVLITSLVHRIDALEASLRKVSVSNPNSTSVVVDSDYGSRYSSSSVSLRDLAARTIQTHFRAFLARRSGALRFLKELAVIRSSLNALKASAVSAKTRVRCHALSQKSMDLLHRVDSIQGSDPMVRRGKRSISRELVRFMESLDSVAVTKQVEVASSKVMKKNVSFVEPSRKSRVSVRTHVPLPNGEVFDLDNDQIELVENLCRRVEDIGEEPTVEVSDANEEEEEVLNEEESSSQPTSDGGNKVKNVKKNYRVVSETSGDEFSFAPPLPVQMEPRRG